MFSNENFFTFQEFLNSIENLNKIQKENEIFNKIQKENLCLKNEIENLKKSNENLQFNLNKITKKFENDLNLSFIANNEKDKQIYLLIDALNKSENLIKNYKEKIFFLLKKNSNENENFSNENENFSNENFSNENFKLKYENEIKKNKELKINIKIIFSLLKMMKFLN